MSIDSIEVLYDGVSLGRNAEPTVDIVAVHGLNPSNRDGHAVATWTDPKSGHLWLKDALPHSQPTARVLLYSYNSSPAFGNNKDRFIHQANSFLECLRANRQKQPNLPLIMIGHSLGGILIKQPLVNAQNNPKYKDIKQATFGLVFFGTPHSGPTNDVKTKLGKACVEIAQSMPWKVSNDILEVLKKGSLFSDTLYEHWRHQLEQYQIISFYEGIGNVVSRESAVFGLNGERENIVELNASHSDMCRFNPSVKKDMDNYVLVECNIADLCRKYSNLINSLRTLNYNPRLEDISNKHQKSLKWIWNDDEDGPGFVEWLKSDVSIYWITGLPGSGKSTLMKYLHDASKTKTYISTKRHEIILIGYFFHELGTNEETNFESLLASILEALLISIPTLASLFTKYFAELKKRQKSDSRDSLWDMRYLEKALMLIEKSDAFGDALLFVDGLDECSGDHRKQLKFLVRWIKSTQGKRFKIRMCLSSRPLPEIESSLSEFPVCRIHEWTANDISAYVEDRLSQTRINFAWVNQTSYKHQNKSIAEYLTDTIIKKAQGVFLWVELVVNNLIEGIEEGFSDEELRERLDSLPPGLEDLYDRILSKIPERNLQDAKKFFKMVLMRRLELLELTLAIRDPKEVLAKRSQSSYEDHLTMKNECARAEARIKSCCGGLIHIRRNKKNNPNSKHSSSETNDITPLGSVIGNSVEFLHLSVQDYIASKQFATSKSLKRNVDDAFMVSAVGLLKLLEPDQLFNIRSWDDRMSNSQVSPLVEYTEKGEDDEGEFSGFGPIQMFFHYARFPKNSMRSNQRLLLAELDRFCSLVDNEWHSFYLLTALEKIDESEPVVNVGIDSWNSDLLCLCLANGLDTYVKEEIKSFRYKVKGHTGRPLLHFFFDLCYTKCKIPDPEVLRLLLRRGANPNEIFDEKTTWEYALLAINYTLTWIMKKPMNWTEPLMVLLKYRAIPNQRVGRGRTAESTLMLICRNISSDKRTSKGEERLITALIRLGMQIDQDELDWVDDHCGEQTRNFIEETLEQQASL